VTHEVDRRGQPTDLWEQLEPAEQIEPRQIKGVRVGDLDPDEELETMIEFDRQRE
jgi:hypothetical protein